MTQYDPRQEEVSGWAVGAVTFAAMMMFIISGFQIVAGLTAIFNDDFFVVARNYTFDLDTTAWGWIHLLIGVALGATGFGLLSRATWAGVVAIALALLSAIENFFFIPYYPFWAIHIIALDVWVIWALTRPGAIRP